MPQSGTQIAEAMQTPPNTAYTVILKLSIQYPTMNPATCESVGVFSAYAHRFSDCASEAQSAAQTLQREE
jgi:hypothetical protein